MWEWFECRLVRGAGAIFSRFLQVLLCCLSNYVKPLINHICGTDVNVTSGPLGCHRVLMKRGGRYRCYTHNLILRPFLLSLMSLTLLEPVSSCCVWQKHDAGSTKSVCFTKLSCSPADLLCNQQIPISPSTQSVNKIAALNLSLAAGI